MPTRVRSPPVKAVLDKQHHDILLQPLHQVEEERGRDRTRLPPARAGVKEDPRGGVKEDQGSAAVVEEEKEETSEQPAKPPAAPRRKKK